MHHSPTARSNTDGLNERQTTGRLQISGTTIAVFAIAIAYIDGFWVTSLQGAVGAIERNQAPLMRWMRDSTLMLPLFILAVLAALAATRRCVGQNRREFVQLAAAGLLVMIITTGVSIAEVATSAAVDYNLQATQLTLNHASHVTTIAPQPDTAAATSTGTCTGLCAARHATLMADVRAVGYASVLMLLTNAVLVVWVLALRGGRLWKRHPHAAPNTRTPGQAALT